ncbi:S8 family serine peptidase [Pontibacter roseus]|uniref:S8 family serine peptidase n=1 Tax=Pontibacter roseus TaxID=336989 RepID=UPI0003A16B79|nr:S8 family serine peptidase [Pontibacter roseus]
MWPFYRLNHTLRLPALWLLFLLPLGLEAQQAPLQKQHAQKLAPHLHQIKNRTAASYRVQVQDKDAFRSWLQQQQLNLGIKNVTSDGRILLVSGLNPKQLRLLLTSPAVLYVDKPNRVAKEELELKDADYVANNIYAAQARNPQLKGQGMAVSVKESPFNPTDLDLKGRVMAPETFGSTTSQHATTMATLVAGAGNSGPNGRGVTQEAKIAYSDFAELYPDDSQQLLGKGISVQNHSYGVSVENYYGLESQAYDRSSYQHPQLLHIFSSGNSGDKAETTGTYANIPAMANLTGQFKTSKNTMSVGALEPNGQVGVRSSRGPAYDGRVKPELVAHGTGGTSEAAAVVSGIALLVQQAYKEKHNGQLPPASLVKAALINSSEDVGRPGVDFETGYGNADALGAIRTIQESRFIVDALAQGQEKTIQLTVPAGVQLLKTTLVWHDPEAAPNAEKALLHDLDLTLHSTASSHTWRPWVLSTFPHPDSLRLPARRGTDRLNNVEHITLNTPAAGTYTLRVKGHTIPQGPQTFSLVYEYERGVEWLYPTVGTTLLAGELNRITWQGTPPTGKGRLEYRLAGEQVWHSIASDLDLASSSFQWEAPDTVAMAQLRLSVGGVHTLSDEFLLARQLQLRVGFNCAEQVLLHWPKLPNTENYRLYYLGDTRLQPLLTTADTLAVLDKSALPGSADFVAVVPVVQGLEAQYSPSIPFGQTGVGCYITSFLPRQLVMDTVELDLELGTRFQLASITLERQEQGVFKPIETLASVTQLRHQFTDPLPSSGRNLYRVKVTTTEGKVFYSQEEEVIFAGAGYMRVYPNPVAAGQPFHVAVGSDEAQIQLYDQLGRLVLETIEIGVLKEVQTSGLTRGLYIIRLKTDTGSKVMGKVLVL